MSDFLELNKEHRAISIDARNVIDTSWHYSWHWKYDGVYLTDEGMAKMKSDLDRRIGGTRNELERLEGFRQRVLRYEQGIVRDINDANPQKIKSK